jgi:hypothetical protein
MLVDVEIRGRIDGVEIKEAFDKDGNKVDISKMTLYEFCWALNDGSIVVAIPDLFEKGKSRDTLIVLSGFYPSRYRDKTKDG